MTTALVKIGSDRISTILGVAPTPVMLGTGNWWVARAYSGSLSSSQYFWYTDPLGNIWDGTSHAGRYRPPIADISPQPWPTVGNSLVSLCAYQDATWAWYQTSGNDPSGAPFASYVDTRTATPCWYPHVPPPSPTGEVVTLAPLYDHCIGYVGAVPATENTGGTWLAISVSGATITGPYPSTSQFALGTVAYEGTYAQCATYRGF